MPLQSPWVRIGWIATAVFAAAVVALMVYTAFAQRSADAWVRHTLQVERTLRDTQANVEGATGEVRAYVLSGREGWLSSFRDRLAIARGDLAALHGLTADNPRQQVSVDQLSAWLDRHVEWCEAVIRIAQKSGLAAATAEMSGGRYDSDEASLVGRVGGIYEVEETFLDQRLTQVGSLRRLSWVSQALLLSALLVNLVASWRSIEQRKAADRRHQELLERARDYAESVVETVREPLVVLDHDLKVHSANRAFYQQFKKDPARTVGETLVQIDPMWSSMELIRALGEVFAKDSAIEAFALEHEIPGFGRRHLVINARKVYRPGNHTGLALVAIQDDTERRAAELALRQANSELEGFAYSVAHDLRAPLRAMQGFSQALLEDFPAGLGATASGYARHIASAAGRMDELIRDLLEYSRVSRAEMRRVPFPLAEAVSAARLQIAGEIAARNAALTVVEPLPVVEAHFPTVVQALANLIGNACKFVAPGARPEVTVRAERRDSSLRLWVEDKGIGIAPEHCDRIFRVFERLHSEEAYPGTGIGLAIVRKGMERQGGSAGVESTLGGGSRFWIEFKPPSS